VKILRIVVKDVDKPSVKRKRRWAKNRFRILEAGLELHLKTKFMENLI
jgi:hypothetical protein